MRVAATMLVGLFALAVASALAVAAEPTRIPKEALDEMEYRVGTWESTLFIDGEKRGTNIREVTEWAPGGQYSLRIYQTGVENGVTRHGVCTAGWDPRNKQLVEHWHVSDGVYVSYRYHIDKVKNAWVGTFRYADTEGKTIEGKSVVEKKSRDEWAWKGTWVENGKERTRSCISRRVKAAQTPQVSNYDRLKGLEFLIGDWEAKNGDGGMTRWKFNWTPEKNGVQNVISGKSPDGKLQFSNMGVLSWDPDYRRITNWCVTNEGTQVKFLWAKRDDGKWETWLPGSQLRWIVTIPDQNTLRMEGSDGAQVFKRVGK
jgi:hypothetical protein